MHVWTVYHSDGERWWEGDASTEPEALDSAAKESGWQDYAEALVLSPEVWTGATAEVTEE